MTKEKFPFTNNHVLIEKVTKPSCPHCIDIFEHLLVKDPIEGEPSRLRIDYATSGFGTAIILERQFGTREISRMVNSKMSKSTAIKHIEELQDNGFLWSRPEKGMPPLGFYIIHKSFIPSELCAEAEFQRTLISDGMRRTEQMVTKHCRICSNSIHPAIEFLPYERVDFPKHEWSDGKTPDLELYVTRVKIMWVTFETFGSLG